MEASRQPLTPATVRRSYCAHCGCDEWRNVPPDLHACRACDEVEPSCRDYSPGDLFRRVMVETELNLESAHHFENCDKAAPDSYWIEIDYHYQPEARHFSAWYKDRDGVTHGPIRTKVPVPEYAKARFYDRYLAAKACVNHAFPFARFTVQMVEGVEQWEDHQTGLPLDEPNYLATCPFCKEEDSFAVYHHLIGKKPEYRFNGMCPEALTWDGENFYFGDWAGLWPDGR